MTTITDKHTSLLEIDGLRISLGTKYNRRQIIRGFDLTVEKGEIVGILGESGSGKTVSSRMIARLFEENESAVDSGSVLFKGKNIIGMKEDEINNIRGREISYVFQNPAMSLNPYKRISRQLKDFLETHGIEYIVEEIIDSLRVVGIDRPKTVLEMYPFQLSGGQNQRIMICQAILAKPDLLIADEPTSSIDAMLRKKILDLLIDVNRSLGTAILFITHDFDVAKYICSKLVIMYGGLVVEQGPVERIMHRPMHPYTEELIKCAESLDKGESRLYSLEGSPLVPSDFRDECPFVSRCRYSIESCYERIPDAISLKSGSSRCPVRVEMEANDE